MAVHYYSHHHVHTAAPERSRAVFALVQTVWFALAIIEAVLLIRFGLRLLGANPGAPFTALMYNVSAFFLAPFYGILPSATSGRSILEWTTAAAMLIYWLAALAVARLLTLIEPPARVYDRDYPDEVA